MSALRSTHIAILARKYIERADAASLRRGEPPPEAPKERDRVFRIELYRVLEASIGPHPHRVGTLPYQAYEHARRLVSSGRVRPRWFDVARGRIGPWPESAWPSKGGLA